MLVKDVMNGKVVTAAPDTTIVETAKIMESHNIGCLIVVTDGKIAGLITDRDILTKVVGKAKDAEKTTIEDVMTKKVICVKPDLDIEEASKIMTDNGIKKLPVVENGNLQGIVTATDIIIAHRKIMEGVETLVLLAKKEKPVAG
jgi:CBS domain-containing protein